MALRDELRDHGVLKIGAEAVLRRVSWRGLMLVEKKRLPKPYRHPQLDSEVRVSRTLKEARVMIRAKEVGVRCPAIIHVDLEGAAIYMQFIEGVDLRELLSTSHPRLPDIVWRLGALLAKLHGADIYHGDFVPSNVLITGGEPVLIDFGLSGSSTDIEEQAVDLHLFERGVSASHPAIAQGMMKELKSGYESVAGSARLRGIEARIAEIRSRARYVKREAT
ncbi:MAG: Kae1-associated kinase Bud32 [Nitrososphaerota archaeon]|nr:Kae1-associated kinase Bud32 [Candidatus Calditenuaceae archaeon]MDW8073160.1 Kae1-associated kinase Bud32 [Nitrososphaerota archaeon]